MTMRSFRAVLAACAATPALICAASVKAEGLTNTGARPHATPFEETIAGQSVSDPYRWMEAPESKAEVRAWLQAATDHTMGEFGRMPGYEPLLAELLQAGAATAVDSGLTTRGGRTFRLRQEAGDRLPKLVVRDAAGADRTIYDPAAADATGAVNNYSVSPSGRLVALHTAVKGVEVGAIRVLDAASGKVVSTPTGPVWGQFPARWLDDDSFVYVRTPSEPGANPIGGAELRLRRVNADNADDPILLKNGGPEGLRPGELFSVDPAQDSRWVLIVVMGAQADQRLLAARVDALGKPGAWREIAAYDRQVTQARLLGDELYMISTRRQSNGEVLRLNLATGRESAVFPAGDTVLRDILPTRAGLYVVGLSKGFERLLFLPRGGNRLLPVPLPMGGRISELSSTSDGRAATLALSGWLTNKSYYRVEGATVRPIAYGAPTPAELAKFEVLHEEVVSHDGARVPLTILAPRGISRDGSAVAILDGYGGYGVPVTPFYRTEFHVWLRHGGVFAFCGVRGGGDKGRAWHEAGRAHNKPNSQRDFIACGARLTQLGLTSPGRLVAHGGSNGGLVVGPAVLQRPDLFKAAILRKAMLNATRTGASQNGQNHVAEMGDPDQPSGMAGLYVQDAYHWLDRASDAPDFMLSIGLNDSRVEPWIQAKFAAKALARFGDRKRVIVAAADSGHGVGDTREQLALEAVNVMAFAFSVTGHPDFRPDPARSHVAGLK